ncbi:PilZ domain-containing protein [Sphingobium sp. MK2]|uniref:PilZ domain-containing protein n=1 Tax=Sphingobium sp. MK2 TaxID=3116540 RepID=UPI0032E36023
MRLKLFEPVRLLLAGQAARAHLLDLSVTGALVHCDSPPCVGDHVLIETNALGVKGQVMWVRVKRFGVHFDQPLPQLTVDRVVRGD